MEEFIHVTFDKSNASSMEKVIGNDDADEELQKKELSNDKQDNAPCENQEEQQEEQINMEQNKDNSQTLLKQWRYVFSYPKKLILSDSSQGVTTRSSFRNTCEHVVFISQIEPKSFSNAENDESWIMSMQEKLN